MLKKKPTNVKNRKYNMIPCVLFTHLFESHAVYRKYLERNTHPNHTDTLWDYGEERNDKGESVSHYPNREETANSNQNNLKGVCL